MDPNREAVLKALERVIDPELKRNVVELGMVRDVSLDGPDVSVTIALTVVGCPLRTSFEEQVSEHVASLPGVRSVSLSFDVLSPEEKAALTEKLRGSVTERTKGISLDRSTRVLAIASGKGGVGKSSLTVNLAAAFRDLGRRVGILDADVYGHSIPHLLGIRQRPVFVDMPLGTGDVSISRGQLLPRAEVIVFTTPQPLAQEVAVRAGEMARKTNMRLVGAVENMSGDVFGYGGGEALAAALGVRLLGSVPLDPAIREWGDRGEPAVSADPHGEAAQAIRAI